MGLYRNTITGQIVTAHGVVATSLEAKGHWDQVDQVTVGDLKGKALDAELDKAGLPKSGTAEEKRERLAAHIAADQSSAALEGEQGPELEIDPAQVTTTVPSQDQ